MVYSIIKESQLEGAHRLDAEYYQPEYLKIAKILQGNPYKKFSEVISNIINGDEIREYVNEDGLPYLRVSDIKEFFIDLSSVVYISRGSKIKQNIKLEEGDILLSRSGSLGIAAVATTDLFNSVISSHLMRIPVKNINPYFLVAFLNSKFGKNQIMQRNNGAVVPEINHPSLREMLVPIVLEEKQKEIEDLVKSAYIQIQESNKTYSQAEQLLLEKLGIKDLHLSDELFYIVSTKETKETKRFDAEYWQLKYKKLLSYLNKKFEIKKLRDLVNIKKGIEPGSEKYQEEGKPFIRVSNLSKFGINDNDQKYLTDDFYHELKRSYQPKMGEILLSKDATPGIAYVVKESIEGIIAGGILRLRVEADLEPEYLALIINSLIGQYQMERDTGGSVIVHWRPEQIRNICIPIIEKSTQQEITSLVKRSHTARKKAKELLEKAKQKVEKMILGK